LKKNSPSFEINGDQYEYHWYEHTGIGRFEIKLKILAQREPETYQCSITASQQSKFTKLKVQISNKHQISMTKIPNACSPPLFDI